MTEEQATIDVLEQLSALFRLRGQHRTDGVSQLEHALQAATLAEEEHAPAALVVAALAHDVGHLLRADGDDLAALARDNRHEELGRLWLARFFGPDVTEPVRLHVHAKRYLCAVDDSYIDTLSPASLRRLEPQGGPLSRAEADAFEVHPFFAEALALRRLDDQAKCPGRPVPDFDHYRPYVEEVARTRVPQEHA